MRTVRWSCVVAVILGITLLFGTVASAQVRQLSVVTGGTGGVYYVLGGGLAELLTRRVPNVNAVAEVTSASVDNLFLVDAGEADIAFTLADTAYLAVRGEGPFAASGPLNIRALVAIYPNFNHLVTTAGSGINSVSDLRGKRVSTGSPGSGTEVTALRILQAYGLDPDRDIRRELLGAAESADALRDGRIDAFFWSGGYPTGAVSDIANSPRFDIYIVPMGDIVPKLLEEHGPFYSVAWFRAGYYAGDVKEDTPTVGVPNLLMVNADMDEELAYQIVKAIFEYKHELELVHPAAEQFSLDTAATSLVAEYHPGAIRYYKEMGVWPHD
ncbi:MAG: C4-dicarboxylate ABC transporter substrate-binding protein [Firmicutes bacterium ZCTH02-B6]|nr:MAG: C4-dicarboxylate ABC transporter substrate-binding protein [Firmicutes bacterium ZCTH02-B6]